MTVIKEYNPGTSQWETIVVGKQGPQGATGAQGAAGQGVAAGGTTGQVLAKVSATNYDTEWVDGWGAAPIIDTNKLLSGRYYQSGRNTSNTATGAASFVRATPLFVPQSTTFDRIACNVTTAGTAAALVRLGIYKIVDGVPTSLLLDAGDVAADSTGVKEVTISLTLNRGWYALAANRNENAIALRRTVVSTNLGDTSISVVSPQDSWQWANTYGAMLATATSVTYQTAFAYVVALRVA